MVSSRGPESAPGAPDPAHLAALLRAGDVDAAIEAIQDAYAKKQPAVPVDQLKAAVESMQQRQQAKMQAEFTQLANENKTKSVHRA